MHVPVCLGVLWVPIYVPSTLANALLASERSGGVPTLPPTTSGSAAWLDLGCLCLGLAGCVSLSGSLVLAPPRDLGSLGPALPSQPGWAGGQAWGLLGGFASG